MEKYLKAIEDASTGTVEAVKGAMVRFPEIEFDYFHWVETIRHELDGVIKVACYDREVEVNDFDKLLTAKCNAYDKSRDMLEELLIQ